MDYSNVLKSNLLDFQDVLLPNNIAIFCGAGISFNSGLPLAGELQSYLLRNLIKHEEDYELISKEKIPFEYFLGLLDSYKDIRNLILMFREGTPNLNHKLISILVKLGFCKIIVTTNFDKLIETELDLQNIDYDLYYHDQHFQYLSDLNHNRPKVIKIHGSIDDLNSIKATVYQISNKKLSENLINSLEFLFCKNSHKYVLILGYSYSDIIDILPVFKLLNSDKKYISIQHKENSDSKVEISGYLNNVFQRVKGKTYFIDTDIFVKNTLAIVLYDFVKFFKVEINWKAYANGWFKELEDNIWIKHQIASNIFSNHGYKDIAIKYAELALPLAMEKNEREIREDRFEPRKQFRLQIGNSSIYRCLLYLARLYYEKNDLLKSREYIAKCVEEEKKYPLLSSLEKSQLKKLTGDVYSKLNNHDGAIDKFIEYIKDIIGGQIIKDIFDIKNYTVKDKFKEDTFSVRDVNDLINFDISSFENLHFSYRLDIIHCYINIIESYLSLHNLNYSILLLRKTVEFCSITGSPALHFQIIELIKQIIIEKKSINISVEDLDILKDIISDYKEYAELKNFLLLNDVNKSDIELNELIQLAEQSFKKGNWEATETLFEKIISKGGDYVIYSYKLAICFLNGRLSKNKIEKINYIIEQLRNLNKLDLANEIEEKLKKNCNNR